ncbi:hypothetical protein FRC10_003131 [Ceratobasidium sp. 414]|nr:hypothetical protein FRC10_003131 [Ceratobasidium sp. 414]
MHGDDNGRLPFYIYDWVSTESTKKCAKSDDYIQELNAKIAKLPPESNLTCVIDCCASGRILNNSVKLVGAGFRGPESKSLGDKIRDAIPDIPVIRRWRKNTPPPEENKEMEEEVPQAEREMDNIKANVLWTEAVDKDTAKTLQIGKLYEDVR